MSIDLLVKEDFRPRGMTDVARRLMGKAALTPEEFARLSAEQKRLAFTFCEVHKARVVQRLRDSIATALRNGTPYRQVRAEMLRILKSVGAESVPMHRLQFLFEHHATRSMAEAQREFVNQDHVKRAFPYLQYKVVQSPGHRREHEAFKDQVFRVDDPFWNRFYPPWDWGCKCYVVPRSQRWVDRQGVKVQNGGAVVRKRKVDAGPAELRTASTAPDLTGLDGDLRRALEAALKRA